MRFLMTINGGGPTPDEQLYAEMGRFVEELSRAGTLVATGGLDPNGTRMSATGGRVTFTDGPYAESKETIASFALVDVATKEALALAERFWAIVRDGEGDMRLVYGPDGP
ncbi:YciI family protein [Luedemannella flava]